MTTKVRGSVLADTAVTAGNYGGATTLQTVTVDAQGRITYAANITSGVLTAGTIGQGADIIIPSIQYNALGQIVAATNNTLRIANTTVTGVVQLADSVSNTSTTAAATASAVKAAFDAAASNASTALSSAQANTGAGLIIAGAWANSAFSQANLAYGQANTSYGSFAQANLAYAQANTSYGAFAQANLAFNTANTANSALNATNLTSGTVPSARISGSYTGITGVGTLAAGSIPGTLISSVVANATTATNGAKAWVLFDGTNAFSPNPSTSAIRGSYNVTSITKSATGAYLINFTNNMSNINYATVVSPTSVGGSFTVGLANYGDAYTVVAPTVSAVAVVTMFFNSTYKDVSYVSVAVFN
jgi:hypothetical protein